MNRSPEPETSERVVGRLWWFYVLPLLLWMGLIFAASTRAGQSGNSAPLIVRILDLLEPGFSRDLTPEAIHALNFLVRKISHVTEYALLTLLAVRAVRFGQQPFRSRYAVSGGAIAVLYAVSDEIHQAFVPGRTSSARDVLIDSIGIIFVVCVLISGAGLQSLEKRLRGENANGTV